MWLRRSLRWALFALLGLAAGIALYVLAALVLGRIPRNADWRPTPGGPVVFVVTNGVHADLVLPAVIGERDLRADYPLTSGERWANWVGFGWGNRRFFLEVPTWADLDLGTALSAVFLPTATLVHVSHYTYALRTDEGCVRLEVSPAELAALLAWVDQSFARDAAGAPLRLDGAGYPPQEGNLANNEFFEGRGAYHLFRTCNDWAARGLASAGIRAPLWSPFDRAIFHQLAKR